MLINQIVKELLNDSHCNQKCQGDPNLPSAMHGICVANSFLGFRVCYQFPSKTVCRANLLSKLKLLPSNNRIVSPQNSYGVHSVMPRFIYVLIFIFGLFLNPSITNAEDVKCKFLCKKMKGKSNGAEYHEKPIGECWVYAFWKKGNEFKHFAGSPKKTDGNGLCGFSFKKDATYFIYFSGKELPESEVTDIATKSSNRLLRFYVSEKQPEQSVFTVAADSGTLKAVLNHSLPYWITLLQKIESVVGTDKPEDVLTKTRKLYYDDENWDRLIARKEISNMLEYDKTSGKILRHDVPIDVIENISFVSKRVDGKDDHFKLDGDKDRLYLERHDFVSLNDGSLIQVGHVLTGFEAEIYGTDFGNKLSLIHI